MSYMWGRQWPKSICKLCGQNVIRVTLVRVKAVAEDIYDHSFTGVKIGGELYNQIMDDKERLKQWTCCFCGKRYVVSGLARDCEIKCLEKSS